MSKNVGLNEFNGLKQKTLNPLSFKLVIGRTSISGPSGSPTTAHQSSGIVNSYSPIFKTAAGAEKDSRNINGIKK